MKLIDLYFYIGTMWRHDDPSMFYGALLFHADAIYGEQFYDWVQN